MSVNFDILLLLMEHTTTVFSQLGHTLRCMTCLFTRVHVRLMFLLMSLFFASALWFWHVYFSVSVLNSCNPCCFIITAFINLHLSKY